jgi:3-oxocholest-4-en-26-oate---CoA ligase
VDVNLADLVLAVAQAVPDRCALVCGSGRRSYPELMTRSEEVARHLTAAGLAPDETVGLLMLNSVEYVEVLLGCMVARTIPVNISYRYTGAELSQLIRTARLSAIVVDAEHAGLVASVAAEHPSLRYVLVAGGAGYETALASSRAGIRPDNGRSGDDKLIICTGGTTGLPKGVLWRHEDFFFSALAGGNHYGPPHRTVEAVVAAAVAMPAAGYLIAAPLMHGSGTYTLFTALLLGTKVVLSPRFDAAEVLRLAEAERAIALAVVGDAMARPVADEIAAGGYDLSSLAVLGSGGALLSPVVRGRLHELLPEVFITDRFGGSETGADGELQPGNVLTHSGNMHVLDDSLRPALPGEVGWLAKSGHVALGYYEDEAATRARFPVVDGVRYALLGDLARAEPDGSIVVLGRGNTCINTGGEKVFPEEVEQVLKAHPAVLDAVVAGVPDERFGERVGAVVSLRAPSGVADGAAASGADGAAGGGVDGAADVEGLREHCRLSIAGYKVPARIVFVPEVVRSPAGKADYRWARGVLAVKDG